MNDLYIHSFKTSTTSLRGWIFTLILGGLLFLSTQAYSDVIIQEDFEDGQIVGNLLEEAEIHNPSLVNPLDTRNTQVLSLVQGDLDVLGAAWFRERIPLKNHYTVIVFDFWMRHSSQRDAGEGLSAVLQFGSDLQLLGDAGGRFGTCNLGEDYVSIAFDVLDQGEVDPETWCDGTNEKTCHVELNSNLCPGAESSIKTNIDQGVQIPDLLSVGNSLVRVSARIVIDDGEISVYLRTKGDPAFHPDYQLVLQDSVDLLHSEWARLGFIGATSQDHDSKIEVDNVVVRILEKPVPGNSLLAFGSLHKPIGGAELQFDSRKQVLSVEGIDSPEDRICVSLEALGGSETPHSENDPPPTEEVAFYFNKIASATRGVKGREILLRGGEDLLIGGLTIHDEVLNTRVPHFSCHAFSPIAGVRPVVELLLNDEVVAKLSDQQFTLPEIGDEVLVGHFQDKGGRTTYYQWKLKDIYITSYQTSGAGGELVRQAINGLRIQFEGMEADAIEFGHFASDYLITDEEITEEQLSIKSLGEVQVTQGIDALLVINNIGATGDDGVRFEPQEPAHFFEVELGPIEPGPCGGPGIPGVTFCGIGESPDGSSNPLAQVQFRQGREGVELSPEFPSLEPRRVIIGLFRHGIQIDQIEMRATETLTLSHEAWPRKISLETDRKLAQIKAPLAKPVILELGRGVKREIDEICIDPVDPRGPGSLIAEVCAQFICVDPIQIDPNFSLPPLPPNDLIPTRLEVTQAVQDLNNSVRLVAGKRTFVRFHARSHEGNHGTYAQLHLRRGNNEITINPLINHGWWGHITVRENPDRAELTDSFLFEIPPGFRSGNVEITGELNPITEWRSRYPKEFNYANNSISTTVSFESTPTMRLVFYRIGYPDSNSENGIPNGTMLWPDAWQIQQTFSWLRRAYPIHAMNVIQRNMTLNGNVPDDGQPINSTLSVLRTIDMINYTLGFGNVHPSSHYYAIASDVGKFMRGWGWSNPPVASGPTGTGSWGWDFDGTYGDWYTGHELGHTFGRGHPVPGSAACGHSDSDASYPYANAAISPTTVGNNALYGFDSAFPRRLYEPDWSDVMSYCDNQWISDYTYEGILDRVQAEFPGGGGGGIAGGGPVRDGKRILLNGTIFDDKVDFQPAVIVDDPGDVVRRIVGDWTIVLRGGDGKILGRYPFNPSEGHSGPTPDGLPEEHILVIHELVPLPPGTEDLEVLSPDGVVHSISAGLQSPEVTLMTPNGGETFEDGSITVRWEASDPDGDDLTFHVDYSADNGNTWEVVAIHLSDFEVNIAHVDLKSAKQGRFRVTASDGLNSASDTSDGSFVVANLAPELELLSPTQAVSMSKFDTLPLMAAGFDQDVGQLDSQIRWVSNLDGELGFGAELIVYGLSVGVHEITVTATDGKGGETSLDVPPVTVYEAPFEAPNLVNDLTVSPPSISWELGQTDGTARIQVSSVDTQAPLRFTVEGHPDWIELSSLNGVTDQQIIINYQDTGLEPGIHEGEILITSPDVELEQIVEIQLVIPEPETEVGSIFLRGDVNRDFRQDISDPILILKYLFLGNQINCEDAADCDDNGALNLTDAIVLLERQFLGGGLLPPPNSKTGCGVDPTEDNLRECVSIRCR